MRASYEFDDELGKDLDWRIDQDTEWRELGAEGCDDHFGYFHAAKSSIEKRLDLFSSGITLDWATTGTDPVG